MPSDTFKIIDVTVGPVPMPGTCVICGYDRRNFVDFGFSVDYYGAVLICVQCVNDLANVEQLDFVSRKDYDAVIVLNRSLQKTIQEYEGLRQGLEDGLVGVSRNFRLAFDNVGGNDGFTSFGEESTPVSSGVSFSPKSEDPSSLF